MKTHLHLFKRLIAKSNYSTGNFSSVTQSFVNVSRVRRSLFYVPGHEDKKLNSSQKLIETDCITFDLEDSVPFHCKQDAREKTSSNNFSEKAVRINAVGSGLEDEDLKYILQSEKLEAIVIPKVQSAEDLYYIESKIKSLSSETSQEKIKLIASIESGLAIMNLKEIAGATKRLEALIFAAEDYCADLGLVRTPKRLEMLYGRSAVVNAAAAYQLQAIDLVCLDYKNISVLEEEAKEGYQLGFTGKQAIHPTQIKTIQNQFVPDIKEVELAQRILQGYIEHSEKGKGAFGLDGKVIDLPVVKWAERTLARVPKP